MMNKAELVAKFLRIFLVVISATLCLSLLSACATQPGVGATETALRRLYGEPALVIRLDSGTRWFYTSGPLGLTTYAVDMNKDGIAERVQNVLTDTMLEKIGAGITAEAVLASIGPPYRQVRFNNLNVTAWDYRYRDTWGYTVEFSVMVDDKYGVTSKASRRIDAFRNEH